MEFKDRWWHIPYANPELELIKQMAIRKVKKEEEEELEKGGKGVRLKW